MEERLNTILLQVNSWLTFAEAKNSALLVANGALVLASLDKMMSDPRPADLALLYGSVLVAFSALAMGLSLISLLPRTNLPRFGALQTKQETDNLLFYGDISKYSPLDYLSSLYKANGLSASSSTPIEQFYAEQIIINSRIALCKYECFTAALWLTLIAVFTPVGAAIFWLISKYSFRSGADVQLSKSKEPAG